MKRSLFFLLVILLLTGGVNAQTTLSLSGYPIVTTGWVMGGTGSAFAVDSMIELTRNSPSQNGYIYYNSAMNVTACGQFTVDFDYKISNSGGCGNGDGIGFYFLNPMTGFTGGGGLGFPTPMTGLALTMDTWDNDGDGRNPEYELLGYTSPTVYSEGSGFRVPGTAILASQTYMVDASWHHVRISYNAGTIRLYVNGSTSPNMTGTFPITTAGYFGFSAGTGCAYNIQMVKSVSIVANTISAILGPTTICQGSTVLMSDSSTGGTWASSNTAVATIGSTTGSMTGVSIGTSTITYSYGTGCSATTTVNVVVPPSPISGTTTFCRGTTSTLTDPTTGGTWTSSSTAVATVGSTTGVVTGVTAGTATITYSTGGSCYVTTSVNIIPSPGPITGLTTVCTGANITLGNTVTGGLWTSGSTGVATVGSSSGIVTGVTSGTAIITYSFSGMCSATTTITVNPSPAPISGVLYVCEGSTTTLSDGTSGGTWTSSNITIATVGSTTGVVAGVAAGTANITYSLSTGCRTISNLTVNPLPSIITGLSSVCVAATMTLTDGTPGGIWSSSNTGVATVGSLSGIVTGVSASTVTITYTIATGCYVTTNILVQPIPAPITGTTNACLGFSTTLADITAFGAWSSSDGTIASIDPATGVVSGLYAGTVTITYTLPTGCFITIPFTVNPAPDPITGVTSICFGSTTTLTDAGGGTWTSSNTAVAPVGSTSGIVSGLSVGSATITYRLPTGCYTTTPMTVNPLPGPISGPTRLCVGSTGTLTNSGGGTWSSSNTAVAPVVTSLGLVTGSSAGTATITYWLSTGCTSTITVTVIPVPSAISGPSSVCVGGTMTLTDAVPGGTWSSNRIAVATVGSTTGIVSGITAGTATISYSIMPTCFVTKTISVTPAPSPIAGTTSMCVGGTTTLFDPTPGGTWSSSDVLVATVGSLSATVVGVAAGTATITYATGPSCFAVRIVTVNPTPTAITGPTSLCAGDVITLGNSVSGGIWTSNNTAIATIGSTTGILNGVLAGTSVITYNLGLGCFKTSTITVTPMPGAITGSTNICVGLTTTLSNSVSGGTWTSLYPLVAPVGGTSGVVTGVALGTSIITYQLPTGCFVTTTVTVNPAPGPITGPTTVCSGNTITLIDGITGGSWSSSNMAVGTIGSTSGVFTGVAAGTSTITYSLGLGCIVTTPVTVYTSPTPISGATALCVGATIPLGNGVPGGTWVSSNTGVATIGSTSGSLFGVSLGTSVITYRLPGGCLATTTITVSPTPGPILGSATVCVGGFATYTNIVSGGLWTNSGTAMTIGSVSGIATGVAVGTSVITYSLGSGCTAFRTVSVIAGPAPITGATSVCIASTTIFTDLTIGGTWLSSDNSIATVGSSSGVVSGVAAGSATITYTAPTGCFVTKSITVNPIPGAITGTMSMCVGACNILSNSVPGGVWSSSSTGVATVGSSSGNVCGVTAGTATITYMLGAGCIATTVVTITPTPAPIGGIPVTGVGSTTTLTNTVSGGIWTCSDISIATVGSLTGIVTGVSLGTATITYTIGGCLTTRTITVTSAPTPIGGPGVVCTGTCTTLTNGVGGGVWTSTNPAVATIGSSTGLICGVTVGTTVITYSLGFGLTVSRTVTVGLSPLPIAGPSVVCEGQNITETDPTPGGTWTSSAITIATVGLTTGIVRGVAAGVVTITYNLGSCYSLKTVTVNAAPAAITGATNVCVRSTTTLGNTVVGGVWISSNTGVATIGSASGIVTGVAAGTSIISYIIGGTCAVGTVVTVNPIAPIAGPSAVCVGYTITLTDATPSGTWASSDAAIATVDVGSGIVSGIAAGTAIITYTLATGCSDTQLVTVNPVPTVISGPASVCVASNITLTNGITGGSWASSSTGIAVIGSASGIISGVSAGVVTITYTIAAGCRVTTNVTVNPLPLPIGGPAGGCVAADILLTDLTPGGVWTSGDPLIATIGSTTGLVTGVNPGTSLITYTLPTGCSITMPISINAIPSAIVGVTRICVGQTSILTSATPGVTWSSSSLPVASVGSSSGVVTGVSAGTTIITCTGASGCYTTTTVTIVPVPTAITGVFNVCVGATTRLADAVPGGVWSTGNTAIATIGSGTGILTGVSSGTVLVYYTLGSGCMAMASVIVNPNSPINGPSVVCERQSITLSDTTEGGVWSSTNLAAATITPTGDTTASVYGVGAGLTVISYSLPTGCTVTKIIRVLPSPPPVTGPSQVCVGATITLGNPVFGGTWTSSATTVATVGLSSGIVTGVIPGSAIISYTLGGCPATRVITVNPLPDPISGPTNVCIGTTAMLTDAIPGGTWRSSSTGVATVGLGTGLVTGVTAGSATISYILGTGCVATTIINVNPPPAPIAGSANICIGLTGLLTDATPGGSWTSSDPLVAPVDFTTGVVTGLALGTATITYTIGTGCFVTRMVTVNTLPPGTTGPSNVCVGQSITLSDAAPGGSWQSGDLTIATVGSTTGIVTGVASGFVPITYTLGTGCNAIAYITVDPLPSAIVGVTQVCEGATTNLYSATPFGGWGSSNTAVATVDAGSGLVTGVRRGTATITYSVGCYVTTTVTVNPMPTAITGNTNVCIGTTSLLRNGEPGGTWSSTNTASAPVGTYSGVVTGLALGSSVITYSLGAGCAVATTVSVLPLPQVYTITGGGAYCAGGTGVSIGLSGSNVGVNYLLYIGSTATGTFAGTGSPLDFGLQTVGGTYHVVAISSITSCRNTMAGTVAVIVNPTVAPSVAVTSSVGDTICAGTSTTFTAVPTNGGTSPTYVWTVNGVTVGAGNSYTFIPANADVVKVVLTSNALCAVPDTASRAKTLNVSANQLPLVSIISSPGDTVCKGMAISLTAAPIYGGFSPSIVWRKFGLNVSAGPTYSYIPNDGDIISCFMTSSYPCLLQDTVTGNLLIKVVEPTLPNVVVTASPSAHVGKGKTVTLTANVTDAGLHPTYQWLKNGVPIPGATNIVYSSNAFDTAFQDSITCMVTSSGVCPVSGFGWIYILVSDVGVNSVAGLYNNLMLLPNPNSGQFTLKGTIDAGAATAINVEVTNMMGQTIYSSVTKTQNGRVDERISLPEGLANGMYLLHLKSDSGTGVFHFVVKQ